MDFENAKKELINAAKKHPLFDNVKKTSGNIVVERGSLSPEFLFIGEAPGFDENRLGKPFVGRSGKILDKWMEEFSISEFAIINVVPIIPLNEEGKIRPPTKEEITYFRPYVKKCIASLTPKYIICVGKSSAIGMEKEFLASSWQNNFGFIYHPAYFLRNGKDGMKEFEILMSRIGKRKPDKKQKNLADF